MNTALTSPHPLSLVDKSRFCGRETDACIPTWTRDCVRICTLDLFLHKVPKSRDRTRRYVIRLFIQRSNDRGTLCDSDPIIALPTLSRAIWLPAVLSLSNPSFRRRIDHVGFRFQKFYNVHEEDDFERRFDD